MQVLRTLQIRVSSTHQVLVNVVFGEDDQTSIQLIMSAIQTAFPEITSLNYTLNLKMNDSIYDQVKDILVKAYGQIKIGNPLDQGNHMGPLIDRDAVQTYLEAIQKVKTPR